MFTKKQTPLGRGARRNLARRRKTVLAAFVLAVALVSGAAFAFNAQNPMYFAGNASADFKINTNCACGHIGDWPMIGQNMWFSHTDNWPTGAGSWNTSAQTRFYHTSYGRFEAWLWVQTDFGGDNLLWLQLGDDDPIFAGFVGINMGSHILRGVETDGFIYNVYVGDIFDLIYISAARITGTWAPHDFCNPNCRHCLNLLQNQFSAPSVFVAPALPTLPALPNLPAEEEDNEDDCEDYEYEDEEDYEEESYEYDPEDETEEDE